MDHVRLNELKISLNWLIERLSWKILLKIGLLTTVRTLLNPWNWIMVPFPHLFCCWTVIWICKWRHRFYLWSKSQKPQSYLCLFQKITFNSDTIINIKVKCVPGRTDRMGLLNGWNHVMIWPVPAATPPNNRVLSRTPDWKTSSSSHSLIVSLAIDRFIDDIEACLIDELDLSRW